MIEAETSGKVSAAEDLLNRIRIERFRMPKRLRLIADSLLESPEDLSVLSINELAARLDVSASALVRFAKAMGFSGYSPMQKVLLHGMVRKEGGYRERVRGFARGDGQDRAEIDFVFEAFASANARAMDAALQSIDTAALEAIVAELKSARMIGVAGRRRAYPLAFYLYYGLSQLDRDCILIDGAAGMGGAQGGMLGAKDVMVVITFAPYAEELIELAEAAKRKGARILAITDTDESPICAVADRILHVTEANLNDIRSISVTSTVIQTMFVALGMEIEVTTERSG